MIFTAIPGKVSTVLLSMKIATVLTFNQPIKTVVVGGDGTALLAQTVNNERTLVIQPRKKAINTNLLVVTKDNQYNYFVKIDEKRPHSFINVVPAKSRGTTRTIKMTNSYEIREGQDFLIFKNRSRQTFTVNDERLKPGAKTILPIGAPVFLNSERVFN
jgi:type IV secretory pathway VirB9-like protein